MVLGKDAGADAQTASRATASLRMMIDLLVETGRLTRVDVRPIGNIRHMRGYKSVGRGWQDCG